VKGVFLATFMATQAGGACAQSSVTLYGRVDSGIQYESGLPHGSQLSAQSADFESSLVGLEGTEDLGGGSQVVFQLEGGFSAINGNGAGNLFWFASTVGIANDNFGKLIMGNLGAYVIQQYSSYYLDPQFLQFYSIATLIRGRNIATAGSGMQYMSPNWGGLVLSGEYDLANSSAWNGDGGYGSGRGQLGGAQGRSDAIEVRYNGSRFLLLASYDEKRDPNGQFSNVFVTSRSLLTGGTFTLGQVKVYMGYQHLSAPNASVEGYFGTAAPTTLPAGTSLPTAVNHEWIGAAWQVTPSVGLNAAAYHANVNNGNGNATLYTLAGQYNLSKRTFLYAEGCVHNSATSNIGLGDGYSDPYGANNNNDPVNGGTNTVPDYGHGQFGTFAGIMHHF
jgi:predicted porin